MATIVTRAGKGSPLTSSELDQNQINLNTDKAELSGATFTGEITANGGIALGDNDKATFGAGDDLQIYHDGSNSYIVDTFVGDLTIQTNGPSLNLKINAGENALTTQNNGGVTLYYDNSPKIATTSTGCDISGTATMDGLTVDGNATISNATNPKLEISDTTVPNTLLLQALNGDSIIGTSSNTSLALKTNNLSRIGLSNGGDISFYEDTGSTAKLFWDANAESLTIGNATNFSSALANDLQVGNTSGHHGITIVAQNNSDSSLFFGDNNNNDIGKITYHHSSNYMSFNTNASERMRIDSSGNVGIGTSSAAYQLDTGTLGHNSTGELLLTGGNSASNDYTQTTLLRLRATSINPNSTNHNSVNAAVAEIRLNHQNLAGNASSGNLTFYTNSGNNIAGALTERMRIDSSGNLLVGTSDSTLFNNTSGGGANILSDGLTIIARQTATTADTVFIINDTGAGGSLQEFRKDGNTVGSIGNTGTDLYIGTGDVGLSFYDYSTENAIFPYNPSTNSHADALIDLGRGVSGTERRFKDLYLSGGVYLGGTVAANKLDDYESGTFTPKFCLGTSSTDVGSSYTKQVGSYRKVGNVVHYMIDMTAGTISTTSASFVSVHGLPFTAASSSDVNSYPTATFRDCYSVTIPAGEILQTFVINGASFLYLQKSSLTTGAVTSVASWDSAGRYNISGFYFTD